MTAAIPGWRSAARSETGKVRAGNEDAVLDRPQQGLWAVADGMGGHRGGALASRLIVDGLAELRLAGSLTARLGQVRQCLHRLNRHLGQTPTVTAACPDPVIGSTVVALLIEAQRAACVWAGDSRCYLWRNGRLYQLTRDHSLVQQLIDEQRIPAEQAATHPAAHALTRAVGVGEALALEVVELDVLPGDAFLLCSDGLYQDLAPEALGSALALPSAALAVRQLFDRALDGPARDNLSAVVIRR